MFNPIFVVGPGRCGTSVTAGILHQAGVFMGETLFPPRVHNPKGYFEDMVVDRALLDGNYKGLDKILTERDQLNWPWGLKFSRTADKIGLFVDRYPGAKFIRCRRPMVEIRKSIARTEGRTPTKAQLAKKTVFEHREEILDQDLHVPLRLDVWFKDLVYDKTEETVDLILDYCEIPVSDQKRRELYKFVDRRTE